MIFKAVIEMPMNTRYKYEMKENILYIDRVLSIPTPVNYGFISDTMAADGDPVDIFIASREPIPPCTRVAVKVVGMFLCLDNGVIDNKLVGRIVGANDTIPLVEIRDYLEKYKPGFEVHSYTEGEFEINEELSQGRIK